MKATKIVLWILLSLVVLTISGFVMKSCGIFKNHAYKSMENAVINYDEYQNIYHTCEQINMDLGVIKTIPDNDPQFAQFSKAQRISALQMNLNRWIQEYNAKSKHIEKSLWKSKELPHTLSTNFFPNY